MQDVAGPSRQSEPTDERLLRDYVASQDAAAFAAIVRRHGGLVSGVCRRVLSREQDVEDAFQATFLVLVRKAHSLTKPNLLGHWLYGVAYRVASKMRSANIRQCTRETAMVDIPAPDSKDIANGRDLRSVLDDELRCLPERYRRPIVLFYLEGKNAEEVAAALGRPRNTVLSQLARAREQLRVRLSHRNLALSVGVLASFCTGSAGAAVSDRMFDLGMQTLPASGAIVSTQVGLLAQQILKEMLHRRLWIIGSLLVAASLAAWVGFLFDGAPHAPRVAVAQADPKSEANALQGDWQVVAIEEDGRVLPKIEVPFTNLRIQDDILRHEGGVHIQEVIFQLHPEQRPKAMDMQSTGYHSGEIHNAIYTLDGDTLIICRADNGTRPIEFASHPGSNVLLYTAKRIRPAGP